eukprot:CAMPEP_0197944492 /NCGR_PEP_ID=MMETSP1439-20131203/125437_1 /TAXON_ID=66791 /ORGANISM="Gonyaulax spinifera, Strain CCMP409" /LENGTH=213 /DNA_ID=CAMNT_0043567747 /DNA_START=79 /DNA_END=718 /DNA_ORIENTATION=-
MASLRAVFLVGVLALAAAAPWEQSDDPLAAALASDEECQAGDGDCALNALQTRAEKLSPEGVAVKPAEAPPAEPALAEKEAAASAESREERHTCYPMAAALASDEECQAGDGDCALNALQTRAEKLSPEGAGAEPAGKPAEAAPAEPAALAEKEAVASTESREDATPATAARAPSTATPALTAAAGTATRSSAGARAVAAAPPPCPSACRTEG